MTYIDDSDCNLVLDDQLLINIKPYSMSMRHDYAKRELDEQRLVESLESSVRGMHDVERAKHISDSIDRISRMTFQLVSRSITSITIISTNQVVSDQDYINEWLSSIGKTKADQIIAAVSALNKVGIDSKMKLCCETCNHQWDDELEMDPTSFFGKR